MFLCGTTEILNGSRFACISPLTFQAVSFLECETGQISFNIGKIEVGQVRAEVVPLFARVRGCDMGNSRGRDIGNTIQIIFPSTRDCLGRFLISFQA